MKAPEIVTKETIYYTVHLWKYRNQYGVTLPVVYPALEQAKKVFDNIIKSGRYWAANIRKEVVYKRDEFSEFSTSEPIASYENNYDFADFCLDMEGK